MDLPQLLQTDISSTVLYCWGFNHYCQLLRSLNVRTYVCDICGNMKLLESINSPDYNGYIGMIRWTSRITVCLTLLYVKCLCKMQYLCFDGP